MFLPRNVSGQQPPHETRLNLALKTKNMTTVGTKQYTHELLLTAKKTDIGQGN